MLDERLEYRQYTFDPQDPSPVCRLKYHTLIKKGSEGKGRAPFNGLRRAMVIVARHYMFDVLGIETGSDIRAATEDTANVLRGWTGDPSYIPDAKAEECMPYLCGWLPDYINLCLRQNYLGKAVTLKKFDAALAVLKDEEYKRFNRSQDEIMSYDVNTTNMITYEGIIYDAWHAKVLKQYYLVCRDGVLKDVKRRYLSSSGSFKTKALNKRQADLMLKTLAAYLLAGEGGAPRQESRLVTKVNLENWIVYSQLNNNYFSEYKYQGEGLFCFTMVGKNQTKLEVLPRFIKDCDPRLIEEDGRGENIDRFMAEHPGYIFYRDEGSGKSMTENRKYD